MAEQEHQEDEIVEVRGGHIKGCRGRVLVALLVVVAMFLLLLVVLFRGMMTTPPPQPKQVSIDGPSLQDQIRV